MENNDEKLMYAIWQRDTGKGLVFITKQILGNAVDEKPWKRHTWQGTQIPRLKYLKCLGL